MAQTLACLRGWNVPLAQAECRALLPAAIFEPISARMLLTKEQQLNLLTTSLACASGIQCFLQDVQFVDLADNSLEDLFEKVNTVLQRFPNRGSLAVRYLRISGRINGISTKMIAGEIGSIAVSHGFTIDLNNPNYEIGLIADASANIVACGWLVGDFDDSIGTAPRRATERPFFKPISLDPRLARLAVNLACGPVDDHAVLDPMTGTGGFVMEATTMGRHCLAIDMNSAMVEGAQQNVTWALNGKNTVSNYQIMVGDACNLVDSVPKNWHGRFSGVVLDPPYGRNSHGTDNHLALIENTIRSARTVVMNQAKLVLIIPIKPSENDNSDVQLLHGDWTSFVDMMEQSGATIIDRWQEHVHGSLSRLILLATIAPLD
tara:strand:+ start:2016 stop:3143 length:1128 start_codon:yes stop_codon:yes gene_type:complete